MRRDGQPANDGPRPHVDDHRRRAVAHVVGERHAVAVEGRGDEARAGWQAEAAEAEIRGRGARRRPLAGGVKCRDPIEDRPEDGDKAEPERQPGNEHQPAQPRLQAQRRRVGRPVVIVESRICHLSDSGPGERRIELAVADGAAGGRLDAWLAGALPDLGRNQAKRLILGGRVSIGGRTIEEPKRPVKPGDLIVVDLPPVAPAEPAGEIIPLDVVYEDDALIVIDKPAGLVVHPAAGNWSGTLVNALIAHCGDSLSGVGGVARPGIVHRLDKDTTGLMVVAKTDRAHRNLAAQFADHGLNGPLERGYLALVWGAPDRPQGTISAALGRSTRARDKIEVKRAGGRAAVTHYRIVRGFGPKAKPVASLVECTLETGRTHQIRVHMASVGHPLIGDRTYGAGFATKISLLPEPARTIAADFPRQALHAWLLGFEHPETGETMRFESELPLDMAELEGALAKSL